MTLTDEEHQMTLIGTLQALNFTKGELEAILIANLFVLHDRNVRKVLDVLASLHTMRDYEEVG